MTYQLKLILSAVLTVIVFRRRLELRQWGTYAREGEKLSRCLSFALFLGPPSRDG